MEKTSPVTCGVCGLTIVPTTGNICDHIQGCRPSLGLCVYCGARGDVEWMRIHGKQCGPQPAEEKWTGAATKHDSDKPMMSLLSKTWLWGVAAVLSFGARKYAPDNWRKGIGYRRLIDAAMRHITAFSDGEDIDPESGLSHLDHASCCLMFAREMITIHPELDDRYKKGQ